ncbi:ABC transporter substrate-binding protein [Psychrobacter arenosus]|uniref:ABC transporter substrate-binding protein n=1 Tax=Psychrobacter arenosus TaxID=256326 RepID=UPI001919E528|nr:ABC transporter substrate-binding protein [Psychrobacter arenosus]
MKLVIRATLATAVLMTAMQAQAEIKTIHDVLDRDVKVDVPAKRVVLGFYYPDYIAATGADHFGQVVGVSREFWESFNPGSWQLYSQKLPNLQGIGDIGNIDRGTFSLEKTLAMKPDVVILAKWQYDTLKAEMPRFEAANIPVVVVDYNDQGVANHTNSTKIFGQIAGTEARANQAAQEYADGIADIQKRVQAAGSAKPKIYIEFGDKGPKEHSFTFGKNMWGAIADTVGGDNISKPFVENWGPINPEQLLVSQPDVIIISGTEVGMKQTDAMAMGIDISAEEAQRRLKGFTTRNGWSELPAVKNNRVYGIYHTASRSLSDLASAQFMAKTLYPQAFTDIDPEKTYMDFHEKYLPVKPNGTFFIQLGCGASVCKDDATTTVTAPDSVAATPTRPTTPAPEKLSWWDRLTQWLGSLFA